jgi:uncharacterized OB-fold protein
MIASERKKMAIEEGFWTTPSLPGEEPQLIGTVCLSCGEIFFPKLLKRRCVHCYSSNLIDTALSRRGKIHTFSIVVIGPGGGHYHGPIPYAIGYVDLPEGARVETLFAGDLDSLRVGLDVELVIDKLYEDEEGNEILTHKFRPVQG